MTLEEQRTKSILAMKEENDQLKAILKTLRDFPANSAEYQDAWWKAEELIK
ncbi:MAG: hypothetical protein IIZ93_16485 [Acidaminococcaceae bacterium]|jgi:hypothetical protein|nr:hypothetical protein [Acidaminococcaceae bacterium]MBQ1779752.1 hypothetical protein [Acidaminococcaceae bacterium]